VCVVGLGEVGRPTAEYICNKGFETWGYDRKTAAIRNVKNVTTSNMWDSIPHDAIEVYVVCVSTGIVGSSRPDVSAIYDVSEKIMSRCGRRPLVSIESTVPAGTCRDLSERVFKKSVDMVHVPHRYWKKDPVHYGVNQPRVIGGIDAKSLRRGFHFYRELGIPLLQVSSIEVAELSKIVENAYYFLQIAFAEELKMACDEGKWNFDELREACNTKWNIRILEARDGVGGHCLPKDTHYVISLTRNNRLLKTAVAVNNLYQRWHRRSNASSV